MNEDILKKLELVVELMEKSQNTETQEILKSVTEMKDAITKMNGLSEEDKAKIAKFDEMENQIKKMGEELDKFMKAGDVNTNTEDFSRFEKEMNAYLKTGKMSEIIQKAALTTSDGSGGALLPEVRSKEIIKEIIETSPVYANARVYTTSTSSLKIRVKKEGTNNAAAQAEGAAAGTASELSYEFLELKAGKITDKQEVTQEMRDDAEYNVMTEIMQDSGENIAEKVSDLVWNGVGGSGNNEFYGIYKDSTVTGEAFEAEFNWENLVELPYKLKKKVRASGSYYVSTEALTTMRKFKDANGQPLYVAPLTQGEPGMFNGFPVIEDPYMDEVATGKYPVFFGNMRQFYAILRRKGVYMEPKRDADKDMWVVYTRLREGGKVRQKSQGKLFKVKAGE